MQSKSGNKLMKTMKLILKKIVFVNFCEHEKSYRKKEKSKLYYFMPQNIIDHALFVRW